MEKKTEIKKLVIEIDGKEVSLPIDKAVFLMGSCIKNSCRHQSTF